MSEPLTPLKFLARSAAVFPNRLAVIDGAIELTFRELADEAQACAGALVRSGLQPGDRVAFIARNSAELIVAHFAVPLAGGTLIALNTGLSFHELREQLEIANCGFVFADAALVEKLGEFPTAANTTLKVLLRELRVTERPAWEAFLESGEGMEFPWQVSDENQLIAISFTSGTSGSPKGAMYTHRGAYLNALNQVVHQGFDRGTRYLWTLPMFHCNGWCCVWATVAAGATQVCVDKFSGPAIWRQIERTGITHLCAAPTVLNMMLRNLPAGERASQLTITTAGSSPSPTMVKSFLDRDIRLIHVYGLTETYGPYTLCEIQDSWAGLPPDDLATLISRQGVGMLVAERVRVVTEADGDFVDVPHDGRALGEILLLGNTVMVGYYADQVATDTAFRGGWFHTGDVGVIDPDGYIRVVDRSKDIVISGGENISSIQVENAMMTINGIRDVAVVGVPDDLWGEVVAAVVVADGLSRQDVIQGCERELASFKIPSYVEFAASLPRTATGKVRKDLLKAQLIDLYG